MHTFGNRQLPAAKASEYRPVCGYENRLLYGAVVQPRSLVQLACYIEAVQFVQRWVQPQLSGSANNRRTIFLKVEETRENKKKKRKTTFLLLF